MRAPKGLHVGKRKRRTKTVSVSARKPHLAGSIPRESQQNGKPNHVLGREHIQNGRKTHTNRRSAGPRQDAPAHRRRTERRSAGVTKRYSEKKGIVDRECEYGKRARNRGFLVAKTNHWGRTKLGGRQIRRYVGKRKLQWVAPLDQRWTSTPSDPSVPVEYAILKWSLEVSPKASDWW